MRMGQENCLLSPANKKLHQEGVKCAEAHTLPHSLHICYTPNTSANITSSSEPDEGRQRLNVMDLVGLADRNESMLKIKKAYPPPLLLERSISRHIYQSF